ncbi:MAG: CRTAC1 family protein [Planctomycetota bacterium]|nr:CRTAC1 family protein [Planctomycetota bacterium]
MRTEAMIVALSAGTVLGQLSFVEATESLGLGDLAGPHCCFVDLNNDGRPDAVIGRNRVFLNVAEAHRLEAGATAAWPRGFGFVEVEESGLPVFRRGDIAVFADLDNDGNKDCVWTRHLDVNADDYEPPTEGPTRTAWLRGNGDGTFGTPVGAWEVIDAATEAPTAAVAVGDVNRDGALDLYLGNWYAKYGGGLEGIRNQLLLAEGALFHDASARFANREAVFDETADGAARPTYGVMIADLLRAHPDDGEADLPELLDLNYGRRWNRLWEFATPNPGSELRDRAPALGIDGDPIRHGRHPEWLKERAKTDARFDREDEKPFRANGNTFDAAIGDIDNDGDFDLFLAEITHAWAGESSDRSRFLLQQQEVIDEAEPWVTRTVFTSPPELSVDRAPSDPTIRGWNQGDIFCELADFDLDGRLDLLLCSSDYPDNQRLRIYRQQADGSFSDITSWIGIDHVGGGQPSLADIDGDGDLDIMVGQSFNRLRRDQREGRQPRVRVYLNQAVERSLGNAMVLRLVGDETQHVSRDALGAIVRVTAVIGAERVTQSRQIVGIGGHQGKQMDFVAHFGLGDASRAERVEIEWPSRERMVTVLENVEAGSRLISLSEHPSPVDD